MRETFRQFVINCKLLMPSAELGDTPNAYSQCGRIEYIVAKHLAIPIENLLWKPDPVTSRPFVNRSSSQIIDDGLLNSESD